MQLHEPRRLILVLAGGLALALANAAVVHGGDGPETSADKRCYFAGSEYEPGQRVCIDGYEHRCDGRTGVLVRGSEQCS